MTTTQRIRRPLTALALSLLLVGAACGDDDDTAAGDASGSDEAGGNGEMSVEITSPEDGTEVPAPVELELATDVDIGETDTGLHHLHVHYDGNADEYDIVYEEGPHAPEQDLDPGQHTVQLVLANADHSETDVTDEITITVGEGGGTTDTTGDDTSTTEDPYDY